MRILAIDLGTQMGWAYKDLSSFGSGAWNLSKNGTADQKSRYLALWQYLESFKAVRGMPNIVVYERPGNLFGHARKVIPAFQGIIELWTVLNGADLSDILNTEVKKHAFKGNADKEDMRAAAWRKWPHLKLEDNNEIDAVWLLDLFLKKNKFQDMRIFV